MKSEALHRQTDISLPVLAARFGTSTNPLSQALNRGLGVSFFDDINGLRVDEACEALRSSNRTVLEIAEEVGFNSRSTFHTAFKKRGGLCAERLSSSRPHVRERTEVGRVIDTTGRRPC